VGSLHKATRHDDGPIDLRAATRQTLLGGRRSMGMEMASVSLKVVFEEPR
jgi:hypothetical protein